MQTKWKIFWLIVVLYMFGVVGIGWQAYDSTDPLIASPFIEASKLIFIALGGLGIILPTYLNVWQSLETAAHIQDQVRRNIIENTFSLIQKWDDSALLEARNFTRLLKEQHCTLSSDQLKQKINDDVNLKRSAILVFNFFDGMRVSIQHDRIDLQIIGRSLGGVFHDMYERFRPWIREQEQEFQDDMAILASLLPNHIVK